MPPDPTPRLQKLLAYLLKSPNLHSRPTVTNPLAKSLPITEHSAFCALHDNEAEHIPYGVEQGWPTEPNWAELERRMGREMSEYIWDVITGNKGGRFFAMAKEEWQAKGKNKMRNVANEIGTVQVEQPG